MWGPFTRLLCVVGLGCALTTGPVYGQDAVIPVSERVPAPDEPIVEETTVNANAPCLEPPPMIQWSEYDGPFHKLAGTVGRKVERKAAHLPHYKTDAALCSLVPRDKFMLFVHDSIEPGSLLSSAFNAGQDQWHNSDPTFGRGGIGYVKRLAANIESDTSGRFLSEFLLPTVFQEDPRYYRLAHGSTHERLFHAMLHIFVAHRDSGRRMFNFSEPIGALGAAALSDLYHPGNARGFGAMAKGASITMGTDMGFDVLREFWPEIARGFHIPFREFHDLKPRQ